MFDMNAWRNLRRNGNLALTEQHKYKINLSYNSIFRTKKSGFSFSLTCHSAGPR